MNQLSGLDLVSPTLLISLSLLMILCISDLRACLCDLTQVKFLLCLKIFGKWMCVVRQLVICCFSQWQNLTLKLQASSRWQNIFIPRQLAKLHLFRNIKVKIPEKQLTWSGIICVQAFVQKIRMLKICFFFLSHHLPECTDSVWVPMGE